MHKTFVFQEKFWALGFTNCISNYEELPETLGLAQYGDLIHEMLGAGGRGLISEYRIHTHIGVPAQSLISQLSIVMPWLQLSYQNCLKLYNLPAADWWWDLCNAGNIGQWSYVPWHTPLWEHGRGHIRHQLDWAYTAIEDMEDPQWPKHNH